MVLSNSDLTKDYLTDYVYWEGHIRNKAKLKGQPLNIQIACIPNCLHYKKLLYRRINFEKNLSTSCKQNKEYRKKLSLLFELV